MEIYIAQAIKFLGVCLVRAAAINSRQLNPESIQQAITVTEKEARGN